MSAALTPSHDEALAQWLDEEKAVRAMLRPEHGVATMAEIAGLNGLQQMQAMVAAGATRIGASAGVRIVKESRVDAAPAGKASGY